MLEFTVDRNRDPDGSKLRRLLEAQISCERMAAARSLVAHILAITGVVIWLAAIWPDLIPSEVRLFAVAVFGGNLILALGVGIEEIAWRVRLKRRLKANEGVKMEDAHGPD
jgi:hypothetical protein